MTTDTRAHRHTSIDFLRGLVMVIMALDHVRDFFTEVRFDPADLSQTDSALFLTRWITHFCAPVFVLLAGVSAGMMATRKSKPELSRFLLSRGLWLIFIEITVVAFAWQFTVPWAFPLQVIWVIGISMIALAGIIWLPTWAILTFGAIVVLGHNLLDYGLFPMTDFTRPVPFWRIIHASGFTLDLGIPTLMLYPIIPWVGLMPLGYLLAKLYLHMETEARQKWLIRGGLAIIALFVALRAIGLYGDPQPWSEQKDGLFTLWSFLNTLKYPPSLLFLMMTLGPGLLLLGLAERWRGRLYDVFVTFGRVPFFYYILHLYLIHLIALVAAEMQGIGWQALLTPFWQLPQGYGFPLWVAWLVWVGVVVALYPLCRWFAGLKARRKDWWLSYL